MVRETRHLWVGNLPDNIREDRIREHFKRYGRVQNVKLLGRAESAGTGAGSGASGNCATVAFMDIKSASKAHNAEHVLDERTLTTEYYEPAAIPAAGAPSAGSSPAGSGYSGSSSSVNSAPVPVAAAPAARYHPTTTAVGAEENATTACALAATAAAPANWRGTNDSASDYRRGTTPASYTRSTPHHRWYTGSGERAESTPSTPGDSTRRRPPSGSGSSRSGSSSPEPSDTSRASTPAGGTSQHHNHHQHNSHHQQWSSSTSNGRPLAICVRNLPTRSTDSSLKDGLYHEYKKHGKVVWVKVVGQNADRYAVVRFKKPSDVEKALEVSQDKLFFGCKISVAPHQSCDEDAESAKPYETDIDEYHPKATRTLFIGNLEKDITQQQLREKFKHFGRIIEIDIKKGSGGGAGYAFCQYASISSVVEAIRAMDGEYVGNSRVKLGFGKPVATTCVWVDGLTEHTEKQVLGAVSRCGGATSVCVDRAAGAALVHFEQASAAGVAVRELRRVAAHASAAQPDHPRLCVDYASRECQEAFYEQLEKHGGSSMAVNTEVLGGTASNRYPPAARHDARYEGSASRSRASSYGRSSSRTPRFPSLDHYEPTDYPAAADRRYRIYDDVGESPQPEDTAYEDRLQSVVVSPHRSRRHRRDSSPGDRKHSKERHRSSGGSVRRSRSGSRSHGERHSSRRRHRRRREDGTESLASRAGTPLRDELDNMPVEPRRPPRERPPLPMSLPLPKFAVQLLRSVPSTPRPAPAPAPASPSRPPSVSSSSGGSAPHSPSLEERIRSLDEKYEKWSGSRALADAPDRTRLRHRLLEVDINEVKPSEVVLSLLSKRSVFDEDSERLEGAVRAPSPTGSPRTRMIPPVPRALRYPFPVHPPLPSHSNNDGDSDTMERHMQDPRINRPDRSSHQHPSLLSIDSDHKFEARLRLRTLSTDKLQSDISERRPSLPALDKDHTDATREKRDLDRRKLDVTLFSKDIEPSPSDVDHSNLRDTAKKRDSESSNKDKTNTSGSCESRTMLSSTSIDKRDRSDEKLPPVYVLKKLPDSMIEQRDIDKPRRSSTFESEESKSHKEIMDSLLKEIGNDCVKLDTVNQQQTQDTVDEQQSKELHRKPDQLDTKPVSEGEISTPFVAKNAIEKGKEVLLQNHISRQAEIDIENYLNSMSTKEISQLNQECVKNSDKNGKERYNQNILVEALNIKLEKENIEFDKDKVHSSTSVEKKQTSKTDEEKIKTERDKTKSHKRSEKDKHESEKEKSKESKQDKDKKQKEDNNKLIDKLHISKVERDFEKHSKEKSERDHERSKDSSRHHDHHKKDKSDKDKKDKKDHTDGDDLCDKIKKEEKHKHDKHKRDSSEKRDHKKDSDSGKGRKSSRDESSKDLSRKDSTDSSTSKASHDSNKLKDSENLEIKEEHKPKLKQLFDFSKIKTEKEVFKPVESIKSEKNEGNVEQIKVEEKIKIEVKEEKDSHHQNYHPVKSKTDNNTSDHSSKCKPDAVDKQRHYSLDSQNTESKRKERFNSSSSLPSSIGHKRRVSSHDNFDTLIEESKKIKTEPKCPERRESKDSRSSDKHKSTKFNKGHFAKLIESKTKDDKKNQVKPPNDVRGEWNDNSFKDRERPKSAKKSPKEESDIEKQETDLAFEGLKNDLDFLATLQLRSSEEDEKQKALTNEMKEKKRIQQLQQIQELQMQQDAFMKENKSIKSDEKRKEIAREKRMSTDRKSKEEKSDSGKRKNRKLTNSTDSSDSDEPKKHSIFDIVDDGPTYISMYDKVKARSCKNMQKQEEEKRQEKIKAKFSQLKQSRAKREEKKRSSWDEDSDSDNEKRKGLKPSMGSSSEDEQKVLATKKRDMPHNTIKICDFYNMASADEDSRNKLSRKNSRTRIISDTSDDEFSKRWGGSPNFFREKDPVSDTESRTQNKNDDILVKESATDRIKKNSLLNLFGRSESEEGKIKSNLDIINEYKSSFVKATSTENVQSTENDMLSNKHDGEFRKKHKKKQKKHFSLSDDDTGIIFDGEAKHKSSHRHSNKKEKRKDKTRESIDTDDTQREEKSKSKKNKKHFNHSMDVITDVTVNPTSVKKEVGKMEDIFGSFTDDSDRDTKDAPSTLNLTPQEFHNSFSNDVSGMPVTNEINRKRDKKRKDKKFFAKEDENSLDVDAVSKAIEARLFEDSNDGNNTSCDVKPALDKDSIISFDEKHTEKSRKDNKEKKKKKKKNKEERQNRKDHYTEILEKTPKNHHHKSPKPDTDAMINELVPRNNKILTTESDNKQVSDSSSLPILLDSPPSEVNKDIPEETKTVSIDITESQTDTENKHDTEKSDLSISTITLNKTTPDTESQEQSIKDSLPKAVYDKEDDLLSFECNIESSENAVRSIPTLESEKKTDVIDSLPPKHDEKIEEKPRAIISQEETEDAVAALLGESFGGKEDAFSNRYEEPDNNTMNRIDLDNTAMITENIPEEDAEEMRRAVQNLNASEMEMKPDTPVSDTDLLLIDTDTEEAEENAHESDKTPSVQVPVVPTSQSNISKADLSKTSLSQTNTVIAKTDNESKKVHIETNIHLEERDPKIGKSSVQLFTSTSTPVITSWTLTNKNLIEPRVLNIQPNQLPIRDSNQNKATHITANIVQIKTPQGQNLQINSPRPIITTNRVTAPYQIINQMIRTQGTNVQPPTIKIPDPHILYPKQGIVISPRLQNDPRLLSPKSNSPAEKMPSPRITNMTILNASPQNVGMVSPNALPQRSPGQVTVVRMQQPPLSPIQAVHLPHGARMLSPRPNSVLVQTQAPIFNRLPVTPVLAPISKQVSSSNIIKQNNASPTLHQQKIISGEIRKLEQRSVNESLQENTKIILSPTSFQTGQNPTVAAQNRLISMQNALSAANVNPTIHLTNKVLISNVSHLSDKKENLERNHPFPSSQIIHVTGVNQSAASLIHSGPKQVSLQDMSNISRGQQSNVIQSLNSQRLLTTVSTTNVIMDANKSSPSVLSVAAIRSPTVLTKLDSSRSVAATTSTLTNVVMTPVLLKTTSPGTNRLTPKIEHLDRPLGLQNSINRDENKIEDNCSLKIGDVIGKQNFSSCLSPVETIAKCETDFEELLKDNTNEIKVTNDGQKKLEVNVGKAVTVFTALAPSPVRQLSDDTDREDPNLITTKNSLIELSSADNRDQKGLKTHLAKTPDCSDVPKDISNIESLSLNQKELPIGSLQSSNINANIFDTKTENKIFTFIEQSKEIKNDDNDSWSAKDVNIDSVIKKVDSLCNDSLIENVSDTKLSDDLPLATEKPIVDNKIEDTIPDASGAAPTDDMQLDNFEHEMLCELNDKSGPTRRGGRSARGKKSDKNPDRVQTRQISKPTRGTGAKRGRGGRSKLDKKLNSVQITNSSNNLPADVYDFHEEDSGDESSSSPNKGEARPRLILTIKSPLSGQSNVIATSTLSISTKEQVKPSEKINKDEKPEDFVAPSANTRKSRRLQEKDRVVMSDEANEEQVKSTKEAGKRRPTRQAGSKPNQQDKVSDTRKSPRGAKRTRDRSISDASADSGEDRSTKEELIQKEPTPAKVAKVAEPIVAAKPTVEIPTIAKPAPPPAAVAVPAPAPAPAPVSSTPIMKPPKKMISEINAKLASVFEAAASVEQASDRMETEKPSAVSGAMREPCTPEPAPELAAATGDASGVDVRRPDNAPYVMMPVGASEASEARVQSPALPHRPPSTHRPMPADRATPVLIRGGDGEGAGYSRAAPAPAPRYAGMASLPRGAHHPPPAPAPAPAAPPHLVTHKQVAVVGPHLHHPAPGTARVTHTSVPAISPQGQMAISADLARSPPPAHQHTSPITPVFHNGEGPFGHFSQHHYQMYQQHFRATQHDFRTPSPFSRTLEAEGCEAPTAAVDVFRSRPTSARVPRPAHSPIVHHDIHERLVFGGCTRSPPPAHVVRPPASLPPIAAPGPPHASQVPREADSLQMLLRRYPVMWQGLLALKNDSAAVQMHWVGGNPGVAGDTLPRHTDGSTPPLRIAQRMRLEQQQLDQVHRKMKMESEHCMLLALPCGRDHMDVLQQSTNLTHGFITYLQRKQAAGIVNVAPPGHHQAMYTVHIFPSCDFANENLNRIAPDLMHRVADIAHLLIVIATV